MDFEELEIIGQGSFGQIRKVRRRADNLILARKDISYKKMNQKEKSQLLAEFRILKSLVHPNIVQYLHHEHVADEHVVHLYMEYCGGGDLAGLIRQCKEQNNIVPEHVVWSIFSQLVLALFRCHYNMDPKPIGELFEVDEEEQPQPNGPIILHRDIKPDNIFLDHSKSNVKLGDFGLAKVVDQEHLLANTYVGTPFYMAPEVMMDHPSTPQSDIWSLGCVIYELCALHPPFQAKSHLQLTQKVREGIFRPIPEFYSSTLSKTIAACLNVNAAQRPTTATLLRLDVIKLSRKEREVMDLHNSLFAVEEEMRARELKLLEAEQNFEKHQKEFEADFYNRLEANLETMVEEEIEKRVMIRLQQIQAQQAHERQQALAQNKDLALMDDYDKMNTTLSPSPMKAMDVTLGTPSMYMSPVAQRNVRGPRSIKETIITPLRSSTRIPFEDMSNNKFLDMPKLRTPERIGSSLATSSPTANWLTVRNIKNGTVIGTAANRVREIRSQQTRSVWNDPLYGDLQQRSAERNTVA